MKRVALHTVWILILAVLLIWTLTGWSFAWRLFGAEWSDSAFGKGFVFWLATVFATWWAFSIVAIPPDA